MCTLFHQFQRWSYDLVRFHCFIPLSGLSTELSGDKPHVEQSACQKYFKAGPSVFLSCFNGKKDCYETCLKEIKTPTRNKRKQLPHLLCNVVSVCSKETKHKSKIIWRTKLRYAGKGHSWGYIRTFILWQYYFSRSHAKLKLTRLSWTMEFNESHVLNHVLKMYYIEERWNISVTIGYSSWLKIFVFSDPIGKKTTCDNICFAMSTIHTAAGVILILLLILFDNNTITLNTTHVLLRQSIVRHTGSPIVNDFTTWL